MTVENIIHNTRELSRERGIDLGKVLPKGRLNKLFWNWRAQKQEPSIGTIREIADALGTTPAYLMREIVPDNPLPDTNRRRPLELLENTGSGIEIAVLLWKDFGGRLCPGFVKAMDRLDLWPLSQLYDWEGGLVVYGFRGGKQVEYFGTWALEAPGNVVGERDPDRDYAAWTVELWQGIMESTTPQRHACLVRNCYNEEPSGLGYDAAYLPMLSEDKLKLLMVARTMTGLLASESSRSEIDADPRSSSPST